MKEVYTVVYAMCYSDTVTTHTVDVCTHLSANILTERLKAQKYVIWAFWINKEAK